MRVFGSEASLALAAIAFMAGGCADRERPVAELLVSPAVFELDHSSFVPLRLEWRMLAELDDGVDDLRVFLHLVDGDGEMVRTFDHELPFSWSKGSRGDYEVVLYQSALAPGLDAGAYALTAGLYGSDGRRLALAENLNVERPGEYRVAEVQVRESEAEPKFYFSPDWLPTEQGSDLQILARRRLGGSGALRLKEIPGRGELWMALGIPHPATGEELVLHEEAVVPSVRVVTSCGPAAMEISGAGGHQVMLPIEGADDATCDVDFSSNYHVLSADGRSEQTLALEGLAWSDADPLD